MTSARIVRVAILAASVVSCTFGARPAGAASVSRDQVACLDSSSPSYAFDAQVVALLGRFGDPMHSFVYDGGEGVSERYFRFLSHTKCGVIMGFPIDVASPDPPDGLALTNPYLDTAYVVVAKRPLSQAQLKPSMTIGVGMATAPHFYLAGALGPVPNFTADTFQTQEQALDALAQGRIDAAMAWEPSVVKYRHDHPAARTWSIAPLRIQHGRWKIAALYAEDDASEAARFDAALGRLMKSEQFAAIARPYTVESKNP